MPSEIRGGGLFDDTVYSKAVNPFEHKDTVSEYSMIKSPEKPPKTEEIPTSTDNTDADLVQAQFKVTDQPAENKRKNSDSDCAYFSGPENDDQKDKPL